MQKLLQAFLANPLFLPSLSQNCCSNPSKPLLSSIVSPATFFLKRNCSSTPDLNSKNSVLANYLIGSLKFSTDRALSLSSRISSIKSLQNPEHVVRFFRSLGFSDAHIQSIARDTPLVLFANIEKTLIPKISFLQELGLSGPCLGTFISRSPCILKCSLDKTLKPYIHFIKRVLESDGTCRSKNQFNEDLFKVLRRCSRISLMSSRIEANTKYLESCGVVGSQLSSLLVRNSRIFSLHKDKLAELVSRALDMNVAKGSGMLVHVVRALSSVSIKTLNSKFDVFRLFGFSEDETKSILGRWPYVFGFSEAKLRCKLEFFLNNVKMDKSVLVRQPCLLSYSLEERVIPRVKVFELLKSRRLLREDSSLIWAMRLSNEQFFKKFISQSEIAEELLSAYNGQLVNASKK